MICVLTVGTVYEGTGSGERVVCGCAAAIIEA